MTRKQRAELLKLIKAGYPAAAARARLGLTRAEVAAAGIDDEIAEAEEVGRALLLAKAVEAGLNGDAGLLRDVLNRTGTGPIEAALNRLTITETQTLVGRLSLETRERLGAALGGVVDLAGAPLFGFFRMLEEQDAAEPEPAAWPVASGVPEAHHGSENGASAAKSDDVRSIAMSGDGPPPDDDRPVRRGVILEAELARMQGRRKPHFKEAATSVGRRADLP